jgi:hypothetical protein
MDYTGRFAAALKHTALLPCSLSAAQRDQMPVGIEIPETCSGRKAVEWIMSETWPSRTSSQGFCNVRARCRFSRV